MCACTCTCVYEREDTEKWGMDVNVYDWVSPYTCMRIQGTISNHDTTLCLNPLKQKLVISFWPGSSQELPTSAPSGTTIRGFAAIFNLFYKCRGIRNWVWMLAQFHCWFPWGFDVAVFGRLDTSLDHLGQRNINENIPYPKLLLVVVFLVAKEN